MDELIRELNHAIERGEWTVTRIAEATGIGRSSVYAILRRSFVPNLDAASKLARLIGFELVCVRVLPGKKRASKSLEKVAGSKKSSRK